MSRRQELQEYRSCRMERQLPLPNEPDFFQPIWCKSPELLQLLGSGQEQESGGYTELKTNLVRREELAASQFCNS
jgi:hypothetical protein